MINYLDQANLKVAAHYRPDEDVRRVEDWERSMYQKYLDEGACYVRLEGVTPQLEGASARRSPTPFSPMWTACGTSCARPAGEALPVAHRHGAHRGVGRVHPG